MIEVLIPWERDEDACSMYELGLRLVGGAVEPLVNRAIYRQALHHYCLQTSLPKSIVFHEKPLNSYPSEVMQEILTHLTNYPDFHKWFKYHWPDRDMIPLNKVVVDIAVNQHLIMRAWRGPVDSQYLVWKQIFSQYSAFGFIDRENPYVQKLIIGLQMGTLTRYAESCIDPRNL